MRNLALVLLLVSLVTAKASASQASEEKGVFVRALVVPYALGSANGMYYTVGLEYFFSGKHGIGIDYGYNDYNAPEEPLPGRSEIPPRLYSVNRGLTLAYRRYLRLHDGRQNRYRTYVSAFARSGNRSFHPEVGYVPKDAALENRVKYDEQQYSVGVMAGLVTGFRFRRINVDLGAGPFMKLRTAQDQRIEAGGLHTYRSSLTNPGIRFSLTVAYLQPLRSRW